MDLYGHDRRTQASRATRSRSARSRTLSAPGSRPRPAVSPASRADSTVFDLSTDQIAPGETITCTFGKTVSGNAGDTVTDTVTVAVEDDDAGQDLVVADDAIGYNSATVTIDDVSPTISVVKTAEQPSMERRSTSTNPVSWSPHRSRSRTRTPGAAAPSRSARSLTRSPPASRRAWPASAPTRRVRPLDRPDRPGQDHYLHIQPDRLGRQDDDGDRHRDRDGGRRRRRPCRCRRRHRQRRCRRNGRQCRARARGGDARRIGPEPGLRRSPPLHRPGPLDSFTLVVDWGDGTVDA